MILIAGSDCRSRQVAKDRQSAGQSLSALISAIIFVVRIKIYF